MSRRATESSTGLRVPASAAASAAAGNTNLCTRPPGKYPPEAGVWPYFSGTYADYLYLTPDRPFYVVPDELPDASLSWVNCAMGTSAEGLEQSRLRARRLRRDSGAGGLGPLRRALASHRGAAG